MAMVVLDSGEKKLLEMCFRDASPEAITLRLFANDQTPVFSDTSDDYVEATFTGYSAVVLTRASWNDATTNASNKGEISYPDITFTAESAEDIYGYYITDASGEMILAERFSTVRSLTNGSILVITPRLTFASE
jgi:hypothetical protein